MRSRSGHRDRVGHQVEGLARERRRLRIAAIRGTCFFANDPLGLDDVLVAQAVRRRVRGRLLLHPLGQADRVPLRGVVHP